MAITVDVSNEHEISPSELLEWCCENVDPSDQDSVLSAADMLYSLHNNRTFLCDAIANELKHIGEPGSSLAVSPQSRMFGSVAGFGVRVNIWSPPDAIDPRSRAHQDQLFSYLTPHDHNFGLLTVGYLGAGYSTVIHEYDRSRVSGYPGERIELRYLETTSLKKGKVMYYRPFTDVHTQLHPEGVSISLNLLIDHPIYKEKTQYEFDTEQQRIVGMLRGTSRFRQTSILEFVDLLDAVDDNVVDVLCGIATGNGSRYVRLAAYSTLANQRPDVARHLAEAKMSSETSPIVRNEMRRIAAGESPVFFTWVPES